MNKPNLPPEPENVPEPIVRPKKKKVALGSPIEAPEMPDEGYGWTDALYLGSRRAVKTLVNVGGVTLAGAGVAIMKGVPIPLALLGAAGVAVGSALAMGTEKTLKERSKSKGVRWFESPDIIVAILKAGPTMLKLLLELVKELRKRKDGSNG